ncbi:MAG: c-type cytochrome [Planctomycetaceae bacterium]|nr:c-type cytochrome [Planctomycetaceae bacterium]
MSNRSALLSLCISVLVCDAAFAQIVGDSYRFPAVEPPDALATFTVQQGFRLELVAHEPLLSDPIDGCFDAYGRLYLAEMHGYPYSEEVRQQQPEPIGKKDAGIIRLLQDTDRDGKFDSSTIFASGLSWPTSVACWDNGLFVLAPSKLYYLRDSDGDGKADEREVVLEGFSRANVQGLANNMKWGLDGRLYLSGGTNGGEIFQNGESLGELRRRDIALNPRNRKVEFVTGGQQFGHSMDDWGNRFVCSNSNHIQQVLFPAAALDQGAITTAASPIVSIAKEGPAAPVFRTSPAEPWRVERTARRAADPAYRNRLPMTELVPTGFFTSATGVTIYRGNRYPGEFAGNAFIGDVGGNLIHRKKMERNGTRWLATRADEDCEFITSTDTWFRPTNFVNGPDGCLYILDMYRETIEHPVSIPDDIKARVDLESGDNRGRVYRLVPPGGAGRPQESIADKPSAELVTLLDHPNAWQRETAARLLLERQDRTITDQLRDLAAHADSSLGRLHAMYLLKNLALLRESDLYAALEDKDAQLRAHGVRLSRPFLNSDESTLFKRLQQCATDDDPLVRFELALVLTQIPPKYRTALWAELAERDGENADVHAALLLAIPRPTRALAERLLNQSSDSVSPLLASVLEYMGRTASDEDLRLLLGRLVSQRSSDMLAQELLALAKGMSAAKRSLDNYLKSDPSLKQRWSDTIEQAASTVADDSYSLAERKQALGLLQFADAAKTLPIYQAVMSDGPDSELAITVVQTAGSHNVEANRTWLCELAPQSTPDVRSTILDTVLEMTGGPEQLLALVEQNVLSSNDFKPTQRDQLRQHPNAKVREKFASLAQFKINDDRKLVIQNFADAAELAGNVQRAQALYTKHCAQCHRLGESGHAVGPDFKSVKNKSADDLLIAILDPNREAQPNFVSHAVLTTDGRSLTGLIASSTQQGITLRQPEGKDVFVPKGDIEQMKSTGLSLMPNGLEKVLTPQDLADLMALIRE